MIEILLQGLAGVVVASTSLYMGKHIGRRRGRVSALEDAGQVFRDMAWDMDTDGRHASNGIAAMLDSFAGTERIGGNFKEVSRDG